MVGQTTRHPAISLALLALACALLGAAPARGAIEAERVAQSSAEVRDYWTDARLRAAEPVPALPVLAGRLGPVGGPSSAKPSFVVPAAPGDPARAALREGSLGRPGDGVPGLKAIAEEVPDPAAADVSAHGKVFFTAVGGDQPGDYVCSGTTVNSRNRSVVWTAGHCVFPADGPNFATNWIFIPGYHDGAQPYGQWPAKRLATTGPWQGAGNIKYDLGAAVVRRGAEGRLQTAVGARGIAFDQPRAQTYGAYGYPAEPTLLQPGFTGESEFTCDGSPVGNDEPGSAGPETMAIECDMTGGSSGGGWIAGDGTLLSVTSYGYTFELDRLYGPYMSKSARTLYRSVRGKPKKKSSGGKGGKGGKKPRPTASR